MRNALNRQWYRCRYPETISRDLKSWVWPAGKPFALLTVAWSTCRSTHLIRSNAMRSASYSLVAASKSFVRASLDSPSPAPSRGVVVADAAISSSSHPRILSSRSDPLLCVLGSGAGWILSLSPSTGGRIGRTPNSNEVQVTVSSPCCRRGEVDRGEARENPENGQENILGIRKLLRVWRVGGRGTMLSRSTEASDEPRNKACGITVATNG
jgi:hypothetical protein